MKQNLPPKTVPKEVVLPSRRQGAVICPHCWTAQRTERDFCYRCSAAFRYLDEACRPEAG